MKTDNLNRTAELKFRYRDPDVFEVANLVFSSAFEKFVPHDVRWTMEKPSQNDEGLIKFYIRKKGHRNVPRLFEEVLKHRFDVSVERNGDVLEMDPSEVAI